MPIPLSIRGFMADAARLVESTDYYRRLIDFCADWEMNALMFRLTDDQGCAMRFAKHPELKTHVNALTPDEVRELAEYGQSRGVELIPEIESFGHCRYITDTPEYAALCDTDPAEDDWMQGIIPLHTETMRILGDLYRETAALFPGRFLHGGCDEVSWGGSAFSKTMLATKSRAEIWGEYLTALNGIARENGKEFIVWGDLVLRKYPAILEHLDHGVIIHDWEYANPDPTVPRAMAERAMRQGFRVLGGPALIWCQWGPRHGRAQFHNLHAFVEPYRTLDSPRALGVIVTNWVPGRYLQRALWDGIAYAATALNEGSQVAYHQAFPRFVVRHYGAEWNELWADVFRTIYDIIPNRRSCSPPWLWPSLPAPWATENELRAVLANGPQIIPPFARLYDQLMQCAPAVRRNREDFDAFCLTVEFLVHLYWREREVVGLAAHPGDHQLAAEVIQRIAACDQRLLQKLKDDWHAGRSPLAWHELATAGDLDAFDRLPIRFAEAVEFSNLLVEDVERFARLVYGE